MQDAAHELEQLRTRLHDTTLQALELIAGSARDPHARSSQHGALAAREAARLREYLEGVSGQHADELESGLRALVAEARDLAQHEVQLIPGPIDGSVRGIAAAELIAATREAVTNAGKHARASRIVVYCEASGGGALVTIKDDGVGVDLGTIEAGFGVRRSIYSRMARIGGNALLDSTPGHGTLVTLWLEGEDRRSTETRLLVGSDSRQRFLEELGQRQRHGGASTVMAVGIERVHELDEQLGTGAGEELVERLSLVLRAHVRERDVVARVGDDRLGVLLDRVASAEAQRVAERLFQLVLNRATLGHGALVRCGYGVAPLTAQSELTPEQALLAAERLCGTGVRGAEGPRGGPRRRRDPHRELRYSTRSSISRSVSPSGATVDSRL
jgi:diguanylate cyclase (GGDEF)-like protein